MQFGLFYQSPTFALLSMDLFQIYTQSEFVHQFVSRACQKKVSDCQFGQSGIFYPNLETIPLI